MDSGVRRSIVRLRSEGFSPSLILLGVSEALLPECMEASSTYDQLSDDDFFETRDAMLDALKDEYHLYGFHEVHNHRAFDSDYFDSETRALYNRIDAAIEHGLVTGDDGVEVVLLEYVDLAFADSV